MIQSLSESFQNTFRGQGHCELEIFLKSFGIYINVFTSLQFCITYTERTIVMAYNSAESCLQDMRSNGVFSLRGDKCASQEGKRRRKMILPSL